MKENEFTSWLIGAETPSIRYATLRDLLNLSESNRRVIAARRDILRQGPAPAILSRQTAAGNWKNERSYYTPKYFSTHWRMLLLEELRADGSDPRYRQGMRFMLETTAEELDRRLQENNFGSSCFWGNLLRYSLRAERAGEPKVENLVRLLVGSIQSENCRCTHNYGKPCAWGVVRSLYGLAAIPAPRRSREVRSAIAHGIDFLTEDGRLLRAGYPTPGNRPPNPLWFKLNFPLFYQADLLFTLRVLGELDALHRPGVQPALDWLEGLRGRNGRWRGRSPFRQRTWKQLGGREETERWISLQSATILRRAGRPAATGPAA
ncbi:MAG: hypothetical protein ABSC61_04920 [Anaerolineales bacterium]